MKRFYVSVLMLLTFSFFVWARIIHVPAEYPFIQTAINAAVNGDTVLVADSTYYENINFRGKAIVVASHFLTTGDSAHILKNIIDGSQPSNPDSGSTVYFISGEDTNSVLSGFTITGGSGTLLQPPLMYSLERGGGGIFCFFAGPRISDNLISGNQIANVELALGAGVMCLSESNIYYPVVEGNIIRANTADGDSIAIGGGLALVANAAILNNEIIENAATSREVSAGSGIIVTDPGGSVGPLSIHNNTISHNQSTSEGTAYAAVHLEHSNISVVNNTVSFNTVSAVDDCWGAGMFLGFSDGGSIAAENTVSNNVSLSGESRGGGLVTFFTFSLRVQSNLIKHNSATYGGGLASWYSSPVVQGNVVAKNAAQSGGGLWLNWFPFSAASGGGEMQKLLDGPGKLPTIRQRILDIFEDQNGRLSSMLSVKPQIINNTIADNSATQEGGGMKVLLGVAEVMNSILWGNSAFADSQAGGVAAINYSAVQGGASGLGNLDLNPQFSDSTFYYLTPSVSPVIDAGNPHPDYNDLEDPGNPGFPLWPALGTLRNDMGAYGGDPSVTPQVPLIFGPQFRAFVDRVNSAPAPQRPAIVDSFMNASPAFPFIEEDRFVYYIYRGNASTVTVPGDANSWDMAAFSMNLLGGTDLWYRQEVFEPDARLDYKFVLNGSNWILDPLNPRQVSGGFGPNSELAMPAYMDPPEILYYPGIPHGTLVDTTVVSTILNNTRLVRLYLPPGYNPAASDSFPVVLFHDGLEYISLASADNVLDYLISEQRIQPLIAIFVPPVNRDQEYAFNQTAQFEAFITTELMPGIDARYRTRRNPHYRAMAGISFGGLITTQICYNQPENFGLCGPFSPAYWPLDGLVFNTVVNGPLKDLTWYLDWGTYEPGIMLDSRALREILPAKGYALAWNEWHEGHSWGSWRAHLDLALEYFFPGPALGLKPEADVPMTFELMQNYPNPFNPTTTIRYQLPNASKVVLKIYNILGQEVLTLVNKQQAAGEKTVIWDGKNSHSRPVSSGLYIYSLKAGERVQHRKMLLLK
jgi:enterochelin esterase family protein